MCQGDAAPKQRTEGSLKEAGQLFLKHTTFHGLRHVFLSGSYPRRVAWLLAFLTALALLFTWSSNRVRYLLSSPVYSKAQMVLRETPRISRRDDLQPEHLNAASYEETGHLQRGTLAWTLREKLAGVPRGSRSTHIAR